MAEIQAVIFDYDGTLADTVPLVIRCFQAVFEEFQGQRLSDDEVSRMFGPTEDHILQKTMGDQARQAIARYYEHYQGWHREIVKPHPDVDALLAELARREIPVALVTNKSARSLEISLREFGWDDQFRVVVHGDGMRRPKPDPEGIERAAKELGVSPERAIYLGDNPSDIEAGQRAGTKTGWVRWFRVAAMPLTPDYVFDRPAEVLTMWDGRRHEPHRLG